MEHEHSNGITEIKDRYAFLYTSDASDIFGKVDFMLKSGIHLQYQHPDQEAEFIFVGRNFLSLNNYYRDFFGVSLEKGGAETDTYFYLYFEGNRRGSIPADRREFLSEESLIIGIFACKVYSIDFNAEESSLNKFLKLMKEEYEEYKDDFYRLLAQTKSSYTTGEDDMELYKSVLAAFKDFKNLGWVYFKNDEQFVIMPSMERIRKLYAQEINNTPAMITNLNNAR